MKWLFLILIGCTTAPSVQKLTHLEIKHKECLKPLESVSLSPQRRLMGMLQQTTGTMGSVVATGAGLVSDTVVVTTGVLGTAYLCVDGHFCGEVIEGYFGLMEEADMLWSTKKAYNVSSSWRCPQVDHISRAFRKVSTCLHENGEYVAAFEQLGIVEDDHVLKDCVSASEKEKVQELKAQLVYPSAAKKVGP